MLLAFDLDGTIVTHDRVLPDPIRDAILAARDRGHVVTVITGRNRVGAARVLEALGVDCHYGTCQGARIHALGDNHHVELTLEEDLVPGLLERLNAEPDTDFYLSTRDALYVRDPAIARWSWAREEGQILRPLDAYAGQPAHKFIVHTPRAAHLFEELSAAHPHLAYYRWGTDYLEVVASGGHKGNALRHIAQVHGIPMSETVAFGDGPNDLEMLSFAGRAVGVGHLAPGVAERIDEHVAPPEELGVARWLERHVL